MVDSVKMTGPTVTVQRDVFEALITVYQAVVATDELDHIIDVVQENMRGDDLEIANFNFGLFGRLVMAESELSGVIDLDDEPDEMNLEGLRLNYSERRPAWE